MFFQKKNKNNSNQWLLSSLFLLFLLVFFAASWTVKAEYIEPLSIPPEKNTEGVLRIDGSSQVKSGALRLGTDDDATPFEYQLEVVGEGATVSNMVNEQDLKIGQSTETACLQDGDCNTAQGEYCDRGFCRTQSMYVDSENHQVCLGPCLDKSNASLQIRDLGMSVDAEGASYALRALSSDTYGVYAYGLDYGLLGVGTGSSYGLKAVNLLGTAIEGVHGSAPAQYSSVVGVSENGVGIYGENDFYIENGIPGLWAAYFQGPLYSSEEIVATKFLPTSLGPSVVSNTSGQMSQEYTFANTALQYFDGTNVWLTDGDTVYKVRASDGLQIFKTTVGTNPTAVISDTNYAWVTVRDDDVVRKIDIQTGAIVCDNASPLSGPGFSIDEPQDIIFDGRYYWVIAAGSGKLYKMNSLCQQVDIDNDSTTPMEKQLTTQADSLRKIIYNGLYIWVVSSQEDLVYNVNPSSGEAVGWQFLIGNNPQDLYYDNYYYWVTNQDDNTITRYYLSDTKVCSGSATTACNNDTDCQGVGGCFAQPILYNTYAVDSQPNAIVFDGMFLWLSYADSQTITRLLAADPAQQTDFEMGFVPNSLLFDGSYLWLASSSHLYRMYTGQGYGIEDYSSTLTLQTPASDPLTRQQGSMSVAGSGQIGDDSSDSLVADGDLSAESNVWGGDSDTDITVAINGEENCGGTNNCFRCPEGYYVTDITDNGSGVITEITCRPL